MLKPYDEYKETTCDWLEKLPSHWNIKRINSIFYENKELNSGLNSTDAFQFKFGELIPKKKYEINDELAKTYSKYTLIQSQDIMINGLNLNYDFLTQRIALVKEKGIITSAYISLRPRENTYSKYYTFLFKSLDSRKVFNGMGSGIRLTLDFSELKKLNISVPPRDEQDQIVKYLDWQTSKINTFIKAKKKQIELLKEQKQAVINRAVTKGLDDTVPMKDSSIEWLGKVPEHWHSRFLFQIAKEQGISNKGMISDNLLSLSYGKIINKNINKTDGLLPVSFETYQVVDNGNIILRLTDLQNDHKSLRVGLVTQKGIITSAYTCLKPQKNVLANFLYSLLHSYDVCKVFYGMGGGVRQSIGYKDVSKIICFCPPLNEQQAIVAYLEEKTTLIDKVVAAIEKEIELVSEIRQALFLLWSLVK